MRKLILALLLVAPIVLSAQSTFKLDVKSINKLASAKLYMTIYAATGKLTDSAMAVNGVFHFNGMLSEPVLALLETKKSSSKDKLWIFLDNGTIHITTIDFLKYAVVIGPENTAAYERYKNHVAPALTVLDSLGDAYRAEAKKTNKDTAKLNEISKQLTSEMKPYKKLQLEFIETNPSNYVSLMALKEVAGAIINVPVIEPLFNRLSVNVQQSASARNLKAMIDKRKIVQIGGQAPDFKQNDVNDRPVKLSDFRGQYVLVDFWASWCVPCRTENPYVVKAYNKFKDKNFTVLSVSLDRPGKKADWLSAIKADGLNWTNVSDLKFFENEVAVLYGIQSIPQNFLLDKAGKIIAVNLRGEMLDKKLQEVLN